MNIKNILLLIISLTALPLYSYIPYDSKDNTARKKAKERLHLNHSYQYYKIMGDRYFNQMNYFNASRYYEYSLIINPKSAEASYYLGVIYYYLKRYSVARANLKNAIHKNFIYPYDRIKSFYLLSIVDFHLKKDIEAIKNIKFLIKEYETFLDQKSILSISLNPEHYKYAYFLLGLYYRNTDLLDQTNLIFLEKSFQFGYKKDYILYFYYEFYKNQGNQLLSFDYLTKAKLENKNIEIDIKNSFWLKNYDIFYDIDIL